MPLRAGHHRRLDLDGAVAHRDVDRVEQREVGVLTEGQHHGVGVQLLEFAGRFGEALGVETHLLDHDVVVVDWLMVESQRMVTPFAQRLFELLAVRGHLLLVPAVDDDRVGGPEAPRGARRVERGVAAAVDDDASPEQRWVVVGHLVQERDGVEDLGRVTGGNVRPACRVGRPPPGRPRRSSPSRRSGRCRATLWSSTTSTPMSMTSRDLGVEHRARQPVRRYAVAHHATESGSGVDEAHRDGPRRRRWYAALKPAGPAPTTRIRLPVSAPGAGNRQPFSRA